MVLFRSLRIAAGEDVARLEFLLRIDFHRPEGQQPAAAPAPATAAGLVDLGLQILVLPGLLGRHHFGDLARVDTQDGEIIVGDLLLVDCALAFGLPDDGLHVGRQHGHAIVIQPGLDRGDERLQFSFGRLPSRLGFVARFPIGEYLLRRSQRQLPQRQRIEQRLHGVEIFLLDRVVA